MGILVLILKYAACVLMKCWLKQEVLNLLQFVLKEKEL